MNDFETAGLMSSARIEI